ncbi:MAG: hypothetical protein F4023_07745 [Acidobacteria bacterium]|nr:hypothetical protein [Acidobacteriota bacterium]
MSALGERRIAAQVRIGDHPAAPDLAARRHPPLIGAPFFLAGMIGARVLALAISLVIAGLVGLALLLVRRRPLPSA